MLQASKVLRSRDEWRKKATKRQVDLRQRDKSLVWYKSQVTILKKEIASLKQDSKKN